MIALDTNVLIRYLVEDESREQCRRAAALIESTIDAGESVFVSNVVACECVWVLESCYDVGREEIAATLAKLVETRGVRFRDVALVQKSVETYRDSGGDFADYLIREVAVESGCDEVATFDQTLLGDERFVAP